MIGVHRVLHAIAKRTDGYPSRLLDWVHAGQTRSIGRADRHATLLWCRMPVAPQQPLQFIPRPPFRGRSARSARRSACIIAAAAPSPALIVIVLTAVNPVGTGIGFVLASVAMTVVCWPICGWTDGSRSRPGCWCWRFSGARRSRSSVSVDPSSSSSGRCSTPAHADDGQLRSPSPSAHRSIEEAAKGLFLLLMMTGRRRNELNSLTDCLVYAGLAARVSPGWRTSSTSAAAKRSAGRWSPRRCG